MKRVSCCLVGVLCCVPGVWAAADVTLPDNFPTITARVYDANALAEGRIFLAVAAQVEGVGYYLMVLDNDGTPYRYRELTADFAYDFKVQPNGLLSYAQFTHHHSYVGGGHCIHTLLDPNLEIVEEIQLDNGYFAEAHDFQLLPNGHALLFGYYLSQVDMSEIVAGGHPAALVSGGVVQELDARRHAVFQWRTWDAYDVSTFSPNRGATGAVISAFHLNDVFLDRDGNIIVGTPMEIRKLNRQTGEVMWILGGPDNQFTVMGDGANVSHFGGHGTYRLANGNFLMYDNAARRAGGTARVHEYRLDEEALTAELIWNFVPPTPVPAWHRGNAQRLPNGNTLIGWGGANGEWIPACSEVTPDGRVVLELYFDDPAMESYRAFRLPFPGDVEGTEVTDFELGAGNTYEFASDDGDTGVTLQVIDRVGDGYNEVTVHRLPFAPLYPEFPGKAPRVLPVRFTVSQFGIQTIAAQIRFDANRLGSDEPNTLTVYYRPFLDHGLFIPLATTYNPTTDQVRASMIGFGEFVFGYPDVTEIPFPPLLNEPESLEVKGYMSPYPLRIQPGRDYSVNQTLSIGLSWSPVGLADAYTLQVSTDPSFATLDVNEPYVTEARYAVETAQPHARYYWRVKTRNAGGVSDWSAASFRTVPPEIQVTTPNGGERFQRGETVFIRWRDNLNEAVSIDLLRGGTPVQTLDTVVSNGAFDWEVGLTLDAGDDYTVRVRSAASAAVADASDAAFTIE